MAHVSERERERECVCVFVCVFVCVGQATQGRTGQRAVPNTGSLIRSPSQNITTLERRSARPQPVGIESICQVLQTGRAFENDDVFPRLGVLVLERWNHTLRVDRIEPLLFGIDDGKHVRAVELGGQDQGFDVVDVGCFVRW